MNELPSAAPARSLMDFLAEVPDHRRRQGRRYRLDQVLGLACVAVMCGADTGLAISEFGRRHFATIGPLFGFDRCLPPCNSSYHYIFRALDHAAFERAIQGWLVSLHGESTVLAVDGKTLRGSRSGRDLPALHLLTAYCADNGAAVQMPVDIKTNEAKAMLEMLKVLPLEGAVITADAMFAQRDICRAIADGGADYVVAVKDNQPQLKQDIELAFSQPVSPAGDVAQAA